MNKAGSYRMQYKNKRMHTIAMARNPVKNHEFKKSFISIRAPLPNS